MISVEQEPPTMAEAQELLVQSEAFSAALYPPESCHIPSVDDLSGDSARFFIADSMDGQSGVEHWLWRTGMARSNECSSILPRVVRASDERSSTLLRNVRATRAWMCCGLKPASATMRQSRCMSEPVTNGEVRS